MIQILNCLIFSGSFFSMPERKKEYEKNTDIFPRTEVGRRLGRL